MVSPSRTEITLPEKEEPCACIPRERNRRPHRHEKIFFIFIEIYL